MAASKIRWDGTTEDGRTTSVEWGNNPYTWGDVKLALELVGGGSPTKRKARLDFETLLKLWWEQRNTYVPICERNAETPLDNFHKGVQ